jgi:hypothetical protein
MPTVQFLGRVLPRCIKITSHLPEMKWKWNTAQRDLVFRVWIGNSVVRVECDIETYEPEHLVEITKRAADLSRTLVNLIAFSSGHGLSVVLETFIGPDGMPTDLLITNPTLAPLCTVFSLSQENQSDFSVVTNLVFNEVSLFLALNDLIEAATEWHVAPTNCGRVIDRICRMISPNAKGGPTASSWQAMRDALKLSKDYLEWISVQSTGPRHGDAAFVPGTTTTEIVARTWTVMNRFLEYRKRGNSPLKASEFPLLS